MTVRRLHKSGYDSEVVPMETKDQYESTRHGEYCGFYWQHATPSTGEMEAARRDGDTEAAMRNGH